MTADRACEALHSIPSTIGHDIRARVGMAAKDAGVPFEEYDTWQSTNPRYDAAEVRSMWNSYGDGPVKAGTLFKIAAEYGYRINGEKPKSKPAARSATRAADPPRKPAPGLSAREIFARCEPATAAHPYIATKGAAGVPLYTLRVVPLADRLSIAGQCVAGYLVVTAIAQDWTLQSLQFIPPNGGKKLNLPGASMSGASFTVGWTVPGGRVNICEGIGAAWSCWQATGAAAVVCFGAGNMAKVASALRKVDPSAWLVVVADVGKEKQAAEIAAQVHGQFVTMPEGWEQNSDVNDLAQRDGIDVLAALLDSVGEPPKPAQETEGGGHSDQPEEIAPEGSDDALALEFVAKHAGVFHWTNGMGWQRNNGTHYGPDDSLRRFVFARKIARDAANQADKPNEAKRLASSKTTSNILTLVQADPRVVREPNAWDANPFELNTPGGIVDLLTGGMRPQNGALVTQITRTTPDFKASRQLWEKFLADVFMGDASKIDFIQRLFGYFITGDRREQMLFFMFGLGANGKSTLLDLVMWILGRYAIKLPAATLMRTSSDRHPTEIAQLFRKRLAVSSEPDEGQHWNESRIKELTGDETMTARFMRQDFFEFPLTQKHVMEGNYRPRVQGGDAAMARRLVLISFDATFSGKQRDKDLPAKLREVAPSILAWMVEGTMKWHQGGLCIPDSVQKASRDYMSANDDLALWIEECCVIDLMRPRTKAALLYESFSDFIKTRGQHVPALRTWSERMASVKGISKVKDSVMCYDGIGLTDAELVSLRTKKQWSAK
jgi:putative DNA primase/helicase